MAEKMLKTRIQLKYDSYSNWTSNNPVLKIGEAAVATIPAGTTTSPAMANLPNVVIKIGDGVSHYNDLKFVSALAADVHSWAKAADKPTYGYNEITGLEDYIKQVASATVVDTDTQYNLVAVDADNYKFELRSKGLEDLEWTKVADLDLSGLAGRVAALEGLVGSKKVSEQIGEAIQALDMAAAVEAGEGEIIYFVNEADGVVEAKKRALVAADIPDIAQSQVTGLENALNGKETAGAAAAAEAAAKEYSDGKLKERIEALDFEDPNFAEGQFVTKVTEADGVISVERAAVTIANVTGLETRLQQIEENAGNLGDNKQDVVDWDDEAEYSETNKAATIASITNRINALDYTGGEFGEHKFVTKVTEADGVVAAEYGQPAVADISGLADEISRLDGRIDTKQDQLYFTSTPDNADNKVATASYVREAVADLNGAMHFIGRLEALPEDNSTYEAGDVILIPDAEDANVMVEYVFDGTTWQKLGHESIYQLKSEAQTQHETIQKSISDLSTRHDEELAALEQKHDDELDALEKKHDEAIAALKNTDAAVAGQFVTAAVQADGVVTVSRRALESTDFSDDVVPEAAVNGLTERLSGIDSAINNAQSGALQAAKDYTDAQLKDKIEALDYTDTAVEKQFVTAVSEADGVIAVTRRGLEAADIPVIEQTQVNGLEDALEAAAKAGTDAAATAETNAKNYTDAQLKDKIESLDYTDAAVEKNVVTAVSEADGVIAVTRAPLADVAWSGEVKDLKQTDTVLVFNCGNSAVGTENEYV